jgi:hypothetical protein
MYAGLSPEVDRGEFVRLSIQALRECGYLCASATITSRATPVSIPDLCRVRS